MVRDSDNVIIGVMWHDDADAGPIKPQAEAPEGVTLVRGGEDFDRLEYLDTFVATLVDGVVVWTDTLAMEARIEAALAATYVDVDRVYADCVGNRTEEYKDSETDARAFAAAGYVGEPTANVSSFARRNPTGVAQTNEWAAKQIIAQADAYSAAKIAMREQRFDTQADMRACTTLADLAQVSHAWDQFIIQLRAGLGLSTLLENT